MADKQKDCWDKFEIAGKLLVSPVLVAIIAFFANNYFKEKEDILKEKEIALRYVELAIGVLQAKPDETLPEFRNWAAGIVNELAPRPLPARTIEALKQTAWPRSATISPDPRQMRDWDGRDGSDLNPGDFGAPLVQDAFRGKSPPGGAESEH